MRRPAVLLALVALLALAAQDAADPAREAFRRGTDLLATACQDRAALDPARLTRAAQEFRKCLEYEPAGPASLFADARHNLELTQLLLAQAGHPDDPRGDSASSPPGSALRDLVNNVQPDRQCPT